MTDGTYVITVRSIAGPRERAALDDTEVTAAGDTTVLRRAETDPVALHGLLRRGSTSSTFTWKRRNRRQAPGPSPLPDKTLQRGTDDPSREVRR